LQLVLFLDELELDYCMGEIGGFCLLDVMESVIGFGLEVCELMLNLFTNLGTSKLALSVSSELTKLGSQSLSPREEIPTTSSIFSQLIAGPLLTS